MTQERTQEGRIRMQQDQGSVPRYDSGGSQQRPPQPSVQPSRKSEHFPQKSAAGASVMRIAILVVMGLAALHVSAGQLARFAPQGWHEAFGAAIAAHFSAAPWPETAQNRNRAELARTSLAGLLHIRPDMVERQSISLTVSSDSRPFIGTAPGGHIILSNGLIRTMPSREALAFMLAREVALIESSVAEKRMSAAMGRAFFAYAMSGHPRHIQNLVNRHGVIPLPRAQAQEDMRADLRAAQLLYERYGDVSGAFEALNLLRRAQGNHPILAKDLRDRMENLHRAAQDYDWPIIGATTSIRI